MPRRPKKPCPGAGKFSGGCANLIEPGERHCSRCNELHRVQTREQNRNHDKKRGTRQQRGYDESHYRLRTMIFNEEGGLCRYCKEKHNRLTQAQELHHADGNSRNRERDNLIPLCKSCHSSTTAKEHGWGNRDNKV